MKQGCDLALVLFSLSFVCILNHAVYTLTHEVCLRYRLDGWPFDLRWLIAGTRTVKRLITEALFTGDCTLMAHLEHELQTIVSRFAEATHQFGLTVSINKTSVYASACSRVNSNSSQHKYKWNSAEISQPLWVSGKCNLFCWHSWQGDRGLNQQDQSITWLSTLLYNGPQEAQTDNKNQCVQSSRLTSLLYGCETWTLSQNMSNSWSTFT